MNVNVADFGMLLTLVAVIIAWLGYSWGRKKEDKQETKEDTTTQTSFKMQLEYISRGIDDIKLEIRDVKQDAKIQDERINELTVKNATLEASLKAEHKRLNELEQRVNESSERK